MPANLAEKRIEASEPAEQLAMRAEELRLELYDKINALGIGAQGLGGLTTVLDVKVKDYPTHAASPSAGPMPHSTMCHHGNSSGAVPAHWVLGGRATVPAWLSSWYLMFAHHSGLMRRLNGLGPANAYGWSTRNVTPASASACETSV